ncbi:MAG: Rab family GTPase [Candidatus Hodarchaeales archaeon]|jgi:small GTP-binding protein
MSNEFKLLMLGNLGVGKTSLVKRFTTATFRDTYKPTLGTEIFLKEITVDDKEVILQLWDLAGAPNFANIRKAFYQKADAAFLVNDLTQPDTLMDLKQWMSEVEKAIGYLPEVLILGNKSDLEVDRKTSTDDLLKFTQENNLENAIETSAKTGVNVEKAFYTITRKLLTKER